MTSLQTSSACLPRKNARPQASFEERKTYKSCTLEAYTLRQARAHVHPHSSRARQRPAVLRGYGRRRCGPPQELPICRLPGLHAQRTPGRGPHRTDVLSANTAVAISKDYLGFGSSSLPAFCRLQFVITTNATVGSFANTEVWLPDAAAWNKRMLTVGGGGLAGGGMNGRGAPVCDLWSLPGFLADVMSLGRQAIPQGCEQNAPAPLPSGFH